MLDQKDIAKYVMLGIGAINLILLCIFLFGTVVEYPGLKITGFEMVFGKKLPAIYTGYEATIGIGLKYRATEVGFAIVAALFPLAKGIKKVFCHGCCEKEVAAPKAAAPRAAATK